MITMVVIARMPKIFINVFLLHKKKGKEIIMQMAKSLVFQWKPVGGLKFEKYKTLSNGEKLIGSFQKKTEKGE